LSLALLHCYSSTFAKKDQTRRPYLNLILSSVALLGSQWCWWLPEQRVDCSARDILLQLPKQFEGTPLVLDQWIPLTICFQANASAEILNIGKIVNPQTADGVQQHLSLEATHDPTAKIGGQKGLPILIQLLKAGGAPLGDRLLSQITEHMLIDGWIEIAQTLAAEGAHLVFLQRYSLFSQDTVYGVALASIQRCQPLAAEAFYLLATQRVHKIRLSAGFQVAQWLNLQLLKAAPIQEPILGRQVGKDGFSVPLGQVW
jgi:hypothetical protein